MRLLRLKLISNYWLFLYLLIICFLTIAEGSFADSSLLYNEAQFIIGLSSNTNGPIFYSQNQDDAMQKPSLGIDYLRRISGDLGDKALLALQMRLALNIQGNKSNLEPQVYNAYIKAKNPISDVWIGHSRFAYGLGSYFDSHGLLLMTLGMNDFGFDRDWGGGLAHDTNWGDIALSMTTGSGMSLIVSSKYLTSGRVSFGVLNRDNFNFGISKAAGNILQTTEIDFTGFDLAGFYENYEIRAENTSGTKNQEPYNSFLIRGGIKLFDEDRLKLELQHTGISQGTQLDRILSAGVSYVYTGDLAFRAMVQNNLPIQDTKVIFQCYYYALSK